MKKQTFRAKIKDGKLTLKNKFAFNNAVKDCQDGEYDLVLGKHYNKASSLQFGYLYGVVYPLSILALIQSGEEEFKTVEQVDIYWKMKFANKEFIDRHTGEISNRFPFDNLIINNLPNAGWKLLVVLIFVLCAINPTQTRIS